MPIYYGAPSPRLVLTCCQHTNSEIVGNSRRPRSADVATELSSTHLRRQIGGEDRGYLLLPELGVLIRQVGKPGIPRDYVVGTSAVYKNQTLRWYQNCRGQLLNLRLSLSGAEIQSTALTNRYFVVSILLAYNPVKYQTRWHVQQIKLQRSTLTSSSRQTFSIPRLLSSSCKAVTAAELPGTLKIQILSIRILNTL